MNKNLPIAIFTGLAIAAGGTLTAMLWPTPETPAPAAEVAAPEPAPAKVEPAPAPAPAPAKVAEIAPNFDTVRVEPSGDAVISGHATPGAEVVVKRGTELVGKATANAEGSFVLIPEKPLAPGAAALTLETTVNGTIQTSEAQVAVVVQEQKPAIVAKVEPDAPTQVVAAPAATAELPKAVALSTVDYDAKGNIVFQGKASPGNTVRFYVDNIQAGDAKTDATGNWLFAGSEAMAPGPHMLRADELDAAGKVLSRAELPFLRETAEKLAEAAITAPASETAPATAPVQTAAADPAAPATDTAAASASAPAAATGTDASVDPAQDPAAPQPAAQGESQSAAAPAAAVAVPKVPERIVIQPGNSLWKISREVYGKGRMFTIIYEANRDQIKNPNRIYPGQILTAPKQD
jgi:nucleoid-associated protein YgaU